MKNKDALINSELKLKNNIATTHIIITEAMK